MSISNKRIKQIVRECIDEVTSAVVEEEADAIAKMAAEKLTQELDDAYDEADDGDLDERNIDEGDGLDD